MRVLLIFFSIINFLLATNFELKNWEKDLTFFEYLTKNKIDSTKFYNKINPDDIKFLANVTAGVTYFEHKEKNELKEVLIPLGEEMQIHLYKKSKNDYEFEIIPINYEVIKDKFAITIKNNCYSDLKNPTNNPHLANYLKDIFKDYLDFKKLKKGDIVAVDYEQKSIKGLPWGEPKIKAAYIQTNNSQFFAILENQKYKIWTNNKNGILIKTKKIVNKVYKRFFYPLNHIKVTSKFTYKRWHPILHRYRPHLGIDYRAKIGTPIYSVASGKVIYAGWIRGYGKVVKISHGGGIVSLYAHLSKILVKNGQKIGNRKIIAKAGNTGRSTGPHLHLGIYKYGKPINPNRYLNKKIAIGSKITYQKIVKNLSDFEKELPKREKKVYNTLCNLSAKDHKPFKWKIDTKFINLVIKKESNKNNDNRIKLSSGQRYFRNDH